MLARTIDAVRQSIAGHAGAFARGRARRPELAPFASPADVATALDASSTLPAAKRYALVAALVAEHQVGGTSLWSSLLVAAFTPMLLGLRTRMGFPEDEERDHRVLAAFLEAISHEGVARAGQYATVAVQRTTLKALVAERAKARIEADDVAFDESAHTSIEPHAVTLGDACADVAWADARERKLAAIARRSARATTSRVTRVAA